MLCFVFGFVYFGVATIYQSTYTIQALYYPDGRKHDLNAMPAPMPDAVPSQPKHTVDRTVVSMKLYVVRII
jgi:hypothetical protein